MSLICVKKIGSFVKKKDLKSKADVLLNRS